MTKCVQLYVILFHYVFATLLPFPTRTTTRILRIGYFACYARSTLPCKFQFPGKRIKMRSLATSVRVSATPEPETTVESSSPFLLRYTKLRMFVMHVCVSMVNYKTASYTSVLKLANEFTIKKKGSRQFGRAAMARRLAETY